MLTSQFGTPDSTFGNVQFGFGSNASIFIVDISDTLNLTDDLSGFLSEGKWTDTLTFVDDIAGFKNLLSDTLSFSDSMVIELVTSLELSDTLTFTELLVHTIYASMDTDDLILDDEFIGISEKTGDFVDTLVMTESLLQQMARGAIAGDLLEFAEQMKRNFTLLRTFSETITFTESLTGVAVKVLGDSFSFTDAISAFISKLLKDTLEFGDSLSANHVTKNSFTDQVVLFDSLMVGLYSKLVSTDTVVLTDTIKGFATRPIFDYLSVTDSITGVASTPLFDSLAFTETLTFTRVINKSLSDAVVFSDNTSMAKIITLALNDAIIFIEAWQAIRARFGVFSDTLSLTDEQLLSVIPRTIDDTLTLTDELTYQKTGVRTLDDTLSIVDSLSTQTVLTRQLTDTVMFFDAFVVKLLRGKPAPPITTPPIHVIPDTPNPLYPVYEGVIEILPQLVMTGRNTSIVLPPPEFNDFESNQGKVVVQRSMTGRFRVYAKRTTREKLNWRFVLPKYKADELREFMLAEIDTVLNVITWDGDYWNLQILSDTAEFTETGRWAPGGNKTEVTIELVGNRYA